jgi:drug/metabolite transporter (DMT)-like permease
VLTLTSAAALTVTGAARGRWRPLVASLPDAWRRYVIAGVCLTGAYGLVLVAVRFAPVGYVATLRESSVVIGAAAGWLLLHERLGGRRLVSSCVVTVGLVALIAFGT